MSASGAGAAPPKAGGGSSGRWLDAVERVGNRVPHPVMIFVYLIVLVALLSAVLAALGAEVRYEAYDPATGDIGPASAAARSLLTADGVRLAFAGVVGNFMAFQAVGVIIVAMVGVGVAEEAGLVRALIRRLVAVAPPGLLTHALVLVGILSSVAADAGYLVLIPLAAAAFASVGRHPLAGLAAAFAAVASAFLVNILIVPTDGILTEITNDAIRLADPNGSIGIAANVWFSLASVPMLAVLIAVVTERVVEPRLGPYTPVRDAAAPSADGAGDAASGDEARGLRAALWGLLGTLAFLALLALPPGAPLRHPQTGALIGDSPFMASLIVSISLVFLVCGVAYGRAAGTLRTAADAIGAMQKAIAGLAGLILLLLVVAQFIALFAYTNMATLAAVSLAGALGRADLDAAWLLLGFVVVVLVLDVVVTGAVPKWAIFAPVFVPLLMRLGVEPAAVLAAYRVGDSPVNSVTPLNAYFAMIVTFAARYQAGAGVGTVVALMLPYVVAISVAWTALLLAWHLLGLPWGL